MIRAATCEDVPAMVELGRQMLEEAPHFAAVPLSEERLTESLLALIGSPRALVAVASLAREIDGFLIAIAAPHWASDIIEVSELVLYVHPLARGRWLSPQLIERLKDFAAAQGASLVRAGASAGICDDDVVRLYERAGFKRCGACLQL
jgi:GNAT superfamily N-acetyltransferase